MFSHRFSRLAGPALALGGLLWIAASIATVIIGMLTGVVDPGPNAHSPVLVYIGIWFLPLGTLSLAVGLLSLYARLQGRSRGLSITAMVFALIGIAFSLVALIGIVSNKYSLNSMGGGFGSFATIIGTGFLGWAAGTHDRTVTVYEPHHTLAYQNDGRPFPVEITFHFASVPSGTRLTASPKIQLGGIFKLGAPMFHLLLPKLVERIVSQIKKVLETQPPTS